MIDDLKINEALKKRWYDKGYWTHDTIADIWERTSAAHPDREYVCDDTGSRLTYGEVDDKAGRVAAWLVAEGVKAGDVVTLQFPTWAEFTIAYVAVLKVGGVVHPVPAQLQRRGSGIRHEPRRLPSLPLPHLLPQHRLRGADPLCSRRHTEPGRHRRAGQAGTESLGASHLRRHLRALRALARARRPCPPIPWPAFCPPRAPRQAEAIHAHPQQHPVLERVFTSELGRTQGDVMFCPRP